MTSVPPLSQEVILLEWNAPEFHELKRGPLWYLLAGLLVTSLILYGILSKSMTLVFAFLMLTGVFWVTHHHKPKTLRIQITDLGLHYGEQFFPYSHLKQFWIVYHPPYLHCLYLKRSGKKESLLRLQLNGQAPSPVRQLLAREILEKEGGTEPVLDTFSRLLRLQ